jgi:fructose-bisphosphate aldolase/2-amino-3,7-dideoxy-D-threo-hept-6-ulosonate synthase
MVAMDHGFTYGPIKGLENVPQAIQRLADIKPEAYIVHKGQIPYIQNIDVYGAGIIIQLTANSSICTNMNNKELVCEVEEALILGADGVAFQLNIENEFDIQQIVRLSKVTKECQRYNMPLLVMLYFAYNDEVTVCHGIRMCEELGVDFIKISAGFDTETLDRITKSSQVKILVAGGEKNVNYEDFIARIADTSINGVVIGRNIFQRENGNEILQYTYNQIHRYVRK